MSSLAARLGEEGRDFDENSVAFSKALLGSHIRK